MTEESGIMQVGVEWTLNFLVKSLDFIPNVIKKELKSFGKENDEV